MSRNILPTFHSITEYEHELTHTQTGKLLFTKAMDRLCAFWVHNDRLKAFQVLEGQSKVGSIHIAKVKNVVKNINACFVEIANQELCFLPLKECECAFLTNRKPDGRILEGDELVVQITTDAHKTKQASVTSRISVSNTCFAFTLGRPGVSYSGKLSKEDKLCLKKFVTDKALLDLLNTNLINILPNDDVGFVVRTKAADLSEIALERAFFELMDEFSQIFTAALHRTCYSCLKPSPPDYITFLEQVVTYNEYKEIVTDDEDLYLQLTNYVREFLPDKAVRLYQDPSYSLFSLYKLETKLKTALDPRIWLKSGGYIIIEQTEAMTVIDVNSGKYAGKKDTPDTSYIVNTEAAEEIALQLRLRNLSGIIIVDFINMDSTVMDENLMKYLKTLVRSDRQKTVVVDMTPLGLVEITRKKENKTIYEQLKSINSL